MRRLPYGLIALLALIAVPASAARREGAGTVVSAGLTLHYSVTGKGTPVVLLSGGPGFAADYMKPVGAMLARDHTVILLEQRGTGRSVPAVSDKTTINQELLLGDLEALRTKLGYPRWALLGHSYGTYTAMRYAVAFPEHTSKLVLLGTLAPRMADDSLQANIGKRVLPEKLARLGEIDKAWGDATTPQRDALMMESATIVLPAYLYDQGNMPTVLAGMPAGSIKGRTAELLNREMGDYDLRADLAKLHLPVLIVQGRQDPLDPEMAAKTRDAIPGAKLVVLEKCGHFAWIEAPGPLKDAMLAFLKD